jgi:hypothetical protein
MDCFGLFEFDLCFLRLTADAGGGPGPGRLNSLGECVGSLTLSSQCGGETGVEEGF